MNRSVGASVALACLAAAFTAQPSAARAEEGARKAIEVESRQIARFDLAGSATEFGDLEFLGGLELTSDAEEFGSFSGVDFDAEGRLHAVTDRGYWFSALLSEDADSAPTGLSEAWIAPMRDPNGKLPESKRRADAEGLRFDDTSGRPNFLVSFEQVHQVRAFTAPPDTGIVPKNVRLPSYVKGLRANKGLEAIAVAPPESQLSGATIVIAERSLGSDGNHRGFVLSGPRRGVFSIGRTDDFDITDAEFLPGGDLLILERRFSYSGGLAIRLRRLRHALIRPGATLDGATVLDVGMRHQIDNLEGMAVRTRDDGRTIVTLVSDDNHSMLQRTLLLQFAYREPSIPLPRLRPASLRN